MGTLDRSGVRAKSLVPLTRGLAQMTAGDYAQPTCAFCGKPISDDRLDGRGGPAQYCRKACGKTASAERCGNRPAVRGRAARYRFAYEKARAAGGAFVIVQCDSIDDAKKLSQSVLQRRDFQSTRDGCAVSIRLVVA